MVLEMEMYLLLGAPPPPPVWCNSCSPLGGHDQLSKLHELGLAAGMVLYIPA